jgi:hypothetical protein
MVDGLQQGLRVVIVSSAGKLYSSADWEVSQHDSNHTQYQMSLFHLLYHNVFPLCRHER